MYEGWEYRVFGEGRSNVETAKLLGRDPEEVAGKINRDILTTFAEWYRRRRIETGCLGAPSEGESVMRVAMKIWGEDGYRPYLSQDEMESVAIEVCRSCFMNFREQEWPQDIAVQKKFVSYFVRCLRRRLAKEREHARKRCKGFGPLPDSWDIEDVSHARAKARRRERWCKLLLRLSLRRIGEQATAYVHYRYRKRLSVKEISLKLGVSENTLSRKYSETNLIMKIRREVNKMVLSIPEEKMREIAEYFFYHQGMGERAIAELLCIPKSMVAQLLDDSLEAIMEGMNGKGEEIEGIFEECCADPPRNEKLVAIYKQRI